MVLGNDSSCKSIKIVSKEIKVSKSVKHFGFTIDVKLNIQINESYKVANAKIKSSGKTGNHLNSSQRFYIVFLSYISLIIAL